MRVREDVSEIVHREVIGGTESRTESAISALHHLHIRGDNEMIGQPLLTVGLVSVQLPFMMSLTTLSSLRCSFPR